LKVQTSTWILDCIFGVLGSLELERGSKNQ